MPSPPNDADRLAAYTTANNLVKAELPVFFISHAGSGTAFKADVEGGFASPLLEKFDKVKAADRGIVVFMQNKEPLSIYCGDEDDGETLRACYQVKESLYDYGGESGLEPVPALRPGAPPTRTSRSGPARFATASRSTTARPSRRAT